MSAKTSSSLPHPGLIAAFTLMGVGAYLLYTRNAAGATSDPALKPATTAEKDKLDAAIKEAATKARMTEPDPPPTVASTTAASEYDALVQKVGSDAAAALQTKGTPAYVVDEGVGIKNDPAWDYLTGAIVKPGKILVMDTTASPAWNKLVNDQGWTSVTVNTTDGDEMIGLIETKFIKTSL